MIDKETYKKEIVRMWDSIRDDEYKGTETCSGVNDCDECPLNNVRCGESFNAFEMIEIVEKWSKEHPPKKYQVSRVEYDILESIVKTIGSGLYFFECDSLLMSLLKKGYFKGADEEMNVKYYLRNCEVVD